MIVEDNGGWKVLLASLIQAMCIVVVGGLMFLCIGTIVGLWQ